MHTQHIEHLDIPHQERFQALNRRLLDARFSLAHYKLRLCQGVAARQCEWIFRFRLPIKVANEEYDVHKAS